MVVLKKVAPGCGQCNWPRADGLVISKRRAAKAVSGTRIFRAITMLPNLRQHTAVVPRPEPCMATTAHSEGFVKLVDDAKTRVKEIPVAEARQRADRGAQLIDVREPHEFEIARIPDTKLIPLGHVVSRMNEIDPEVETIVHCKGGVRSAKAIEALKRAGYQGRLINLKGGITAWSDDVDPRVAKY